jgi:hypothetical protein
MTAAPSPHDVKLSLGVLFRDAPLSLAWPQMAWMAGLGAIPVAVALGRFQAMRASVAPATETLAQHQESVAERGFQRPLRQRHQKPDLEHQEIDDRDA